MTPFQRQLFLLKWRIGRVVRPVFDWLVATAAVTVFRLVRMMNVDRASNLGGRIARTFGPFLPVNRLGMDNLRHAFPEKSEAELKAILSQVWENLGRTAAEYPHLEEIWDWDDDNPGAGRVEATGLDHFRRLRDDDKPAIVFTAHLANWELPAVCAARHGLPVTAVYRTPNNAYVANRLLKIRRGAMGELLAAGSGQAVAFAMASVLEKGGHLGLLVDQRLTKGFKIDFFGRPASTNPILGRLARRFDCPVHGVRVVRLPNNRFRMDLTDEIELPRDADGQIDPEGAMRTINGIVEGWVRENPGQWLWLHNRWKA
mgnify:CR=1 FL=1